ncbi:MAG: hypothetical protein LUE19_05320 [Clostridiales bacterium]|nr:hypothetical protein [Clostridiales bacterium]
MAEISTKVGENSSVCSAYLKNLMSLGLMHKRKFSAMKKCPGNSSVPYRIRCFDSGIVLCRLFHYKNKQLYLFAKTGFTDGCLEAADKMGNVTLISYAEML